MKLSEAIALVPKSVLAIGRGEDRHPNWPGIFSDAVARLLDANGVKYQQATLDAIAQNVNISSFQRSAAQAAADYINGVVRAPKAKKEKAAPMKKGKRGADPITGLTKGEAKKEAAAQKKAAKEAAALEKELNKSAKKAAKKAKPAAKTPKAKKEAAPKAAKPAKKATAGELAKEAMAKAREAKAAPAPVAEVDPITGV